MATKRPLVEEDVRTTREDVYVSETIHDRKSTFIGYFSPSRTARSLQAFPELKSASHRVAAWRSPSKQSTLKKSASLSNRRAYKTGHDDDGEQWAGKRLEKVLEEMNIEGSVVVARWYGGVMLGPIRFTHIEDVAKQAIRRWQRRDTGGVGVKRQRVDTALNSESSTISHAATTMRPEDIQRKREAIIAELQQRDHSITILRDLLDQKKAKAAEQLDIPPQSSSNPPSSSPSKTPDFSAMTLIRLQALEKARDASIEFLLKEINKAEEEEKRIAAEEKAGEEAIEEAWNGFKEEASKAQQKFLEQDSDGHDKSKNYIGNG